MSRHGASLGSHYKGRLLLSARVEAEDAGQRMQPRDSRQSYFTRPIPALLPSLLPAMVKCTLCALVVHGEDMPTQASGGILQSS